MRTVHWSFGFVLALAACAVPQGEPDFDSELSELGALPSTVGFHRFESVGGGTLMAWRDGLVVGNVESVATFASDPATTTGIMNGTMGWLSEVSGSLFRMQTTGLNFAPLLPLGRSRVPMLLVASAVGNGNLFALLDEAGVRKLVRLEDRSVAPFELGSANDSFTLAADEQYLYTTRKAAAGYELLQRRHDGSGTVVLGAYPVSRSEFWARRGSFAATSGTYAIRPTGAETLTLIRSGGASPLVGPLDRGATVAAIDGMFYVATSAGLWKAPAAASNATLWVEQAKLQRDSAIGASVTCGTLQEYSRGGSLTADARGVHVGCTEINGARSVLLTYSFAGVLTRRIALAPEWERIGPLAVTQTHYCALQQLRYHSSSKKNIVRCVAR